MSEVDEPTYMMTPYCIEAHQWKSIELKVHFDLIGSPVVIEADFSGLITAEEEGLRRWLDWKPDLRTRDRLDRAREQEHHNSVLHSAVILAARDLESGDTAKALKTLEYAMTQVGGSLDGE